MSAPEQPLVIVTGSTTGRGGSRRPLSGDEIAFNKAQTRAFRLANPALFEGPLPPRTAAEQRAVLRRAIRWLERCEDLLLVAAGAIWGLAFALGFPG